MKLIKYICDRCSEQIEDGKRFRVILEQLESDSDDFVKEDIFPDLKCADLCETCVHEVYQFITNQNIEQTKPMQVPEKEKPVPVPEPVEIPPEENRHGNRSVDTLSVLEMLDEGHKIREIAEACSCGISTVSYIKKNYRLHNGKVRKVE
jgi:Homeodomain-like domain